MKLNDFIGDLKGVGKKKISYFKKLEIQTVKDLINHYPIRYIDKSKIKNVNEINNGSEVTIKGKVIEIFSENNYRRKSRHIVSVKDSKGVQFNIIFFNKKQFINRIKINNEYFFYGKFENYQMIHPEFIHSKSYNIKNFLRITPVYPSTKGLQQWQIIKLMNMCLKELDFSNWNSLTEEIIKNNNLCPYSYAINNIHFPKDKKAYKIAKYRLIFEEFFNLQLGMILLKSNFDKEKGISFKEKKEVDEFINNLPFDLTNAQKTVFNEIKENMKNTNVMNRLIQGDVGSGKTIVAFLALYLAVLNGYQGAFMAPTEILAIQHFEGFKEFFENYNINVESLTGSTKNKEELYKKINSGEVDIVIGTHALIQDGVNFNKLGLVITDEQHRFGVRQREKLSISSKTKPDILVMSATPIPRSLSMVIHGDLDISVIDEMPKGRKSISTHYVKKSKKNDMYDFIKKSLLNGRQAYFVCPLVEDSDKLDLLSVEKHFEKLDKEIFKEFKVKMIHGKLKNKEKDEIMQEFKSKKVDILVSTTVIEVGIDVPNANIMVIEHTERFGLSQLHQLRGRVGRGKHQSYCFLLADKVGRVAKQRIQIMVETNDGFKISKKDLELRGPGEILGIRQSGIPEFRLANIIKNNDILIKTQDEIKELLNIYKKGKNKDIIEYVNNKSKNILGGYKAN